LCLLFFFFFQAEDGIRDYKVTGVQTCALPIFVSNNARRRARCASEDVPFVTRSTALNLYGCRFDEWPPSKRRWWLRALQQRPRRSEERRVGKECRSRWWQDE